VSDLPHWLLYFEDATRRPEIFTDEASARARFDDCSHTWACHLFRSVIAADNEIERLSARVAELERGWVSVREGLPKRDERVLGYNDEWPERSDQPFLVHMSEPGWFWDTRRGKMMHITHWRPLPAPPAVNQQEGECAS
jgi:hypothetical protein